MESMGTPCLHPTDAQLIDPYSAPYATRHDPFVYYPPILDAPGRCATHVVDYGDFGNDLTRLDVPNYVFITPDTCSDGHDGGNPVTPTCKPPDTRPGGLVTADAWLSTEVPKILNSAAYQDGGALFITFDENGFSDTDCCNTSGAWGGHIGMLVLGPNVKAGYQSSVASDHYGFLRTVEDAFGFNEHLNLAATAQPIDDIWN